MLENLQNSNEEWLKQAQEKDPTLRVVKRQDLVPLNDMTCNHDDVAIDYSEADFDCLKCQNPHCGEMWLYPKGTLTKELKGEK